MKSPKRLIMVVQHYNGVFTSKKYSIQLIMVYYFVNNIHMVFGVIVSIYDGFNSYLVNRVPYAKMNNQSQQKKYVRCVVPQGSFIGPLLSVIYVTNLKRSLNKSYCILFADDIYIFILSSLIYHNNNEFENLSKWQKSQ